MREAPPEQLSRGPPRFRHHTRSNNVYDQPGDDSGEEDDQGRQDTYQGGVEVEVFRDASAGTTEHFVLGLGEWFAGVRRFNQVLVAVPAFRGFHPDLLGAVRAAHRRGFPLQRFK